MKLAIAIMCACMHDELVTGSRNSGAFDPHHQPKHVPPIRNLMCFLSFIVMNLHLSTYPNNILISFLAYIDL